MFDNLTARLSRTVDSLRGRGRITEDNIAETLREVRMALLEADVALPVVKQFIEGVRARALGSEVQQSLTPGQVFVAILHKELVALMGGAAAGFELRAQLIRQRADLIHGEAVGGDSGTAGSTPPSPHGGTTRTSRAPAHAR